MPALEVREPDGGATRVHHPRHDWRLFTAVVISLFALVAVLNILVRARALRPIADDYCLAAWASEGGLLGGVWTVLNTWSGDALAVTSNILLVGVPLAELPWSVASALPFVIAAAIVAVATVAVLGSQGAYRVRSRVALVLVPVIIAMWWAYWWLPMRFPDQVNPLGFPLDQEYAGSVTFWQNINTAYIIVPATWVIVLVLMWRRVDRPLAPASAFWAALGVLIGLSGPVSVIGFLILLAVVTAWGLNRRRMSRGRWVRSALLALGAILGVIGAFLSPGNQARASEVVDPPVSQLNGVGGLAEWIIVGATRSWWGMLIGWSSLFVLVVSGLLAVLVGRRGIDTSRRVMGFGGVLLLVSWCLHVASAGAEAFSYVGFWHVVLPSLVMFWGLVALGWGIACAIARGPGSAWTVGVIGASVLLVGGSSSLSTMSTAIDRRGSAWASGPAAFGYIPDIDTEWVKLCQERFARYRELPYRGPAEQR